MLHLASFFFLTLLHCYNAQTKTSITPTDCKTVETDAGVALDLVNRHRREGYVFGLFRVADAHELHIGNSSVLFLTLDVLETECPVLSGRHWESCEYGDVYSMDFGQCKIIMYTSQLLKKPQLHGFNCTLSPVPPNLIECKDCPVKGEVLEVTEQHKDIAAKALKKFNSESNHTNYFNVIKVEKVLKTTDSNEVHILGFSIKETNCSKGVQQTEEPLECDFLDNWHAHKGFCKARIVSDSDAPDGTDISCELYHPWQHHHGHRCRHSRPGWPHRHSHHHSGHRHHHRDRRPPHFQSKPEDTEQSHGFNEEQEDSHEESPPYHGRRHNRPRPPHHGPPPPPQEDLGHPPPPYDEQHSPPPPQDETDQSPSPLPPNDEQHSPPLPPHHGPHCPPPPPHGPHHPHPPHHHGPHCPPPPPHGPDHPHPPHHDGPHCPPPPPPPPHGPDHPHPPHHHGPHCPPPPPHGPHHPHPPHHHGPHCPPPPPHGPHHPHPPHHHGPHCPPPPGHHPHPHHHYHRHHCNKTGPSGKYFPFQVTGAIYRIPVLNMQDSLTAPSAKFPELSHLSPQSPSTEEGTSFTDSNLKEMPKTVDFPDHHSQSESCPGKPKLDLPQLLPLFPYSSIAQTSSP
ncbi:histidine-rich glycoprotein isoform X1 [Anser cygnoides]|uniref:histidine-rich glycoprotein isoform X1 n=1 Tax=Anser cygnoides TaxID=8845 RepID=UPI0034D2436C